MIHKKGKIRFLWLFSSIVSVVITMLWWMVTQYHQDYRNTPSHHLIGNRPSTLAALKEHGFPFSFLVIGDPTGRGTSETLIKTALKKGDASFLIILGDFVKRPDIWNHRFFLTEMTMDIKPALPVFLVPGNHDIDYIGSIKNRERRVTQKVYESLYGERNFNFCFNGCLFIICGIDWENPSGYLDYLHHTLSQKGRGQRYIFTFIHFPPKGLASYIEGPLPQESVFFHLLKTYKVTACFFGDYHGHWRGQRNGVSLIVSGGGGRHQRSQPEWGKFNHMLRVTVDQEKFVEEMIVIKKQVGLEDRFEEWVFTHLFPILPESPWTFYTVFIILFIISVLIFIKFVRMVRRA